VPPVNFLDRLAQLFHHLFHRLPGLERKGLAGLQRPRYQFRGTDHLSRHSTMRDRYDANHPLLICFRHCGFLLQMDIPMEDTD